jgi:hypothetical protein
MYWNLLNNGGWIIHKGNRTIKHPVIALSGTGGGCRGWGDGGGHLTNVQCKVIQNCHNKFLLYNKQILIKMWKSIKL